MASNQLNNIFLSASIPLKGRDPKYFDTADIIAIRDSVIALASAVLPKNRLIWGGHPSITPLINFVMQSLKLNIQNHMTLYQSRFFEHLFPPDNNKFKNVILTENLGNKDDSLFLMRKRMFSENAFSAAVFIGGMEGVEDEYNMFMEYHPTALLLPIASTGSAAKILYENVIPDTFKNERLIKDYGYLSLFQNILLDKIN